MKYFLSLCLTLFLISGAIAQNLTKSKYAPYFEEAYKANPTIPKGMLEAIAYANTRIQHVTPKSEIGSCQGLPRFYGVMGLVEDGGGYFNNTLKQVAKISGYSEAKIKADPRINILAFAKAYAKTQTTKRLTSTNVAVQQPILDALTEIPNDNSRHNEYARDLQFYAVLRQLDDTEFRSVYNIPKQSIDMRRVFGERNLKLLSADEVTVTKDRIISGQGDEYVVDRSSGAPSACGTGKPNYIGAIWDPAHRVNYKSGGMESVDHVTIHTIQGSYSSCISWFKNPSARVSAHYVVRSFDGQVTQMVCEKDAAYHVRTNNKNAVGIEHEGYVSEGAVWYTEEMYESSAKLVKDICKRNNLNPLKTFAGPPTDGLRPLGRCTRVKGHQHFKGNNHTDPGPQWDWDRFYRLINEAPEPTVFTDKKGEFYDTGGKDGMYQNQERQTYLIKPKGATTVTLTFDFWDIEGTKAKPYDFMDIYDGENDQARLIGRFTGDKSPGIIISKTGALYLEFRSDCGKVYKGWHATYVSNKKNPKCPSPENLLAKNIFPLGATLSWDASTKADKYIIWVKRSIAKKWTKYTTRKNTLHVTGLGANGLYIWQVQGICGGDSSAIIANRFITSNVGRSDNPKQYTVKTNSGIFRDSGGKTSGYSNYEEFAYSIIPPNGKQVQLTFSMLNTEAEYDILTVYDGPTTEGSVLGQFSGKDLPPVITSTKHAMTIKFKSDKRTIGDGWKATWKTTGKSDGGVAHNGGGDDNNTGGNTGGGGNTNDTGNTGGGDTGNTGGTTTVPGDNSFSPNLVFGSANPETSFSLLNSYSKTFTLGFNDKDRSGKGFAKRFYQVLTKTDKGWQEVPNRGFFYDDFNQGLNSRWKSVTGTWSVKDDRLLQTDKSVGNSNLYANFKQDRKTIYLYHWKAKMSGQSGNKRSGLHFFCDSPTKTNRGTSYFIWIRDAAGGDKAEIYKVFEDKFLQKARADISLESGKVYDYKVLHNAVTGKIEIYVNNKFAVSWTDPWPLQRGKAVSFRSGNCKFEVDDFRIFKTRTNDVKISVGQGLSNQLNKETGFRVSSIVVDKNIKWSDVFTAGSRVDFSGGGSSSNTGGGGSANTGDGNTFSNDFTANLELPASLKSEESFYLVADYNGKNWYSNEKNGFVQENFNELRNDWKASIGSWSVASGSLKQKDASATNGNIYLPVTQSHRGKYLYHWRGKIMSTGDNKRFGLHFFSDAGNKPNRGSSYMVWFRNHDSKSDWVEVYESVADNLQGIQKKAKVSFKPKEWVDCKVIYDPSTGKIKAYLNNKFVIAWTDPSPIKSGKFISFRSGNTQLLIDFVRVYRSHGNKETITVGQSATDMIRYKNPNPSTPAGRIDVLYRTQTGAWPDPRTQKFNIK